MLFTVVECVLGAWLRVCGRVRVWARAPVGAGTECFTKNNSRVAVDLGRGVGGCRVGLSWVLNNCAGGARHCLCCPSSVW